MSRELNLKLSMSEVEAGNRQNLLNVLVGFGDCDLDFNGENGEDYHWEGTIDGGFESNADYLADYVKDIEDDVECINTFFKEWMGNDGYYADYSVDYLTDDKGRVTAISFATMCGY